jgi:mono/diheme cytochrome c family protein
MKTVLKWLGRGVLAVFLLLVVAAGVVYALSERMIRQTYDVPVEAIAIPTDTAAITEGERLARTRGCYGGCHGEAAEGGRFFEDPLLGTIDAPDLTRAVHTLTDEQLVRVIRHGVRTDGSSVLIMPSIDFYHLSDADLGAILGFLRSLPPSDGPETSVRLGPLGRLLFVMGEFQPAAAAIEDLGPRTDPGDGSDPLLVGEYVARTACAECHGRNFEGTPGPPDATPNLRIAAAYTPEQFHTLMRTGEPIDGRDLRLMDDMSRKRFSHFTDAEIDGLYAFLSTGLGN